MSTSGGKLNGLTPTHTHICMLSIFTHLFTHSTGVSNRPGFSCYEVLRYPYPPPSPTLQCRGLGPHPTLSTPPPSIPGSGSAPPAWSPTSTPVSTSPRLTPPPPPHFQSRGAVAFSPLPPHLCTVVKPPQSRHHSKQFHWVRFFGAQLFRPTFSPS